MPDPLHHDLDGDPPVRVVLRRNARARRMSLRISRLDGKVTLTLPRGAPLRAALDFAEERADWIRTHLAEFEPALQITDDAELPVEGRLLRVVRGDRSEVRPDRGEIVVSHRSRAAGASVAGLLKVLARDRLTTASDRYAAKLGAAYCRITLRDTRSRWGSCTEGGALMYSWRLVMAPPEVLDYVAAHEVAHLVEMNHSTQFWATVAGLCPGYKAHKSWLRRNGQDLHRYRFDGP